MTRETKVGLLVGLAFIIVIGILLSDYNRLENQPAPLNTAADTLRSGAATPHNNSRQDEVVPPPSVSAPSHPVPTREEVRAETNIVVRPPTGEHPPVRAVPPDANNGVAANNNAGQGGNSGETEIQRIARQHGEDVVIIPPGDANKPPQPEQTVNGAKQYVAAAGDTLNKLAGRFLGANTKANRDAIVALNPTLKQNPNNIIVGHTYAIPTKSSGTAAALPPPANTTEANAGTIWYTVKENDSLWRIAADQLGDGTAWIAIRDVNKDVLKGGDAVRVNMRLRLPPKSVATTN